jgi:hypothetical protein
VAKEAKQADLVGRLQAAKTRQITVEERKEIVDVVKENDLPAIDLEVFFEFDLAEITPAALPTLETLGAALGADQLKGSIFLVALGTPTPRGRTPTIWDSLTRGRSRCAAS